jgi:DNA-binding GntR family transcriptional regulator
MPQTESSSEAAILRFVRSLERADLRAEGPPLLSVGFLADQLGLEWEPCRQALYELTRRGDLEVEPRSAGFFRLRTRR